MFVVVQVNTLEMGGVILTTGAALFCVITCEAVAVQPFAAVTVTVYVPAAVAFNVEFVPRTAVPLDQEYVPPPVAVRTILGVVHVTTVVVGVVMTAVGAVVFCVMV
jgi:hypothetical protein